MDGKKRNKRRNKGIEEKKKGIMEERKMVQSKGKRFIAA